MGHFLLVANDSDDGAQALLADRATYHSGKRAPATRPPATAWTGPLAAHALDGDERLNDPALGPTRPARLTGWLDARRAPILGAILRDPHRARLAAIYDSEVEAAERAAYGRDYETFGFGDWT